MLSALLARLEAEPAVVEVNDPRTGQTVKITVGAFDLQLYLADLPGRLAAIQAVPAAMVAMSRGDFTPLADHARVIRTLPLYSAMSCMMDCASGASASRTDRIQREEEAFPLAAAINFPFPEICPAWAASDLGPGFRAPVQSDVPTLFISGALDGRTPAGNVEEIRQGFPNSAHLLLENTAHGDHLLLSTPRTGELMVRFMKGEPVSDARIAVPPPPLNPILLA
jgi:pimeloyl-ACP methyl ester carboxylesterase